jgi:hypothetical protein
MKRILRIMEYGTGEVAKELDVSGMPDRMVEKIIQGININLNHERYYIADETEAE